MQMHPPVFRFSFDLTPLFSPSIRYYDMAKQVLESAEDYDKLGELALAYVYYKRWVGLASKVIPQHNYYNTPKFRTYKDGMNVTTMPQVILKVSDETGSSSLSLAPSPVCSTPIYIERC